MSEALANVHQLEDENISLTYKLTVEAHKYDMLDHDIKTLKAENANCNVDLR